MTKVADKIVDVAGEGVKGVMSRFKKHNKKIKTVIKKPIEKDADGWVKAARVTEKVAGVGGRVVADMVDLSAAILLRLSQGFVKATDWLLADNQVLDLFEKGYAKKKVKKNKEGKDKKLSRFTKENPRVAAYLTWYLMLMTAIGGGAGYANKDKIKDAVKDKIENIKSNKSKQEKEPDEVNILDIENVYSVHDANFKQEVVNQNWSEIVIGLLEFETYRGANPKKQNGESRHTYGPGITWVYENGKQHACNGAYVDKVKNFSDETIWNQTKKHCLFDTEVLGVAQTYLKKGHFQTIADNEIKNNLETVTDNQILGLLFAGYQTPASLGEPWVPKLDKNGNEIKDKSGKTVKEPIAGIIPKLKKAGNDTQKIVDAFIAGRDVKKKWLDGTNKRRWWCAMYYIGKISAEDFLSMDRDAFSRVEINTIMKNGHFVYDDSTIEYALGLTTTGTRTVHDFISTHSALSDIEQNMSKPVKHKEKEQKQVNPSMEQMVSGLKAYEAGNYQKAIDCYQQAINLDKDNMEAYSSLALAYKKHGDKTHKIDDYEKSLKAVRDCNARMNANKSLLYDAEVKASTYFNAGLVHEEMAKLEIESGNIESAEKHYNDAKKNFETALANAQKIESEEREKTYEKAIGRVEALLKSLKQQQNTIAFNAGARKIKMMQNQKNHSGMISKDDYSA